MRIPPPAEFLEDFHTNALRTVRLVRSFADADLELRPGPGSMSTAEQINHLCACHNFVRGLLQEQPPTTELFQRRYDVSSVSAAVRSLGGSIGEVQCAVATIKDSLWDEQVSPFGPDWVMSRGAMCYTMIEHEVHHRGQLTVYARMAGHTPVTLYLPVSDTVLDI